MLNNDQTTSCDNTSGYITGFPVSSLIQLLEIERKTCTLKAQCDGRSGFLYIEKGVVLDAEAEGMSGEEAAILILGWENAQINLTDSCIKTKKDIRSSLTRLILDACRRRDELDAEKGYVDELSHAIRLVEANHFKKAHVAISSYLKINPKSSKAWLWYSRCLGSLPAISKALEKCVVLTPKNNQVAEERRKYEKAVKQSSGELVRRCPFCWAPLDRKAAKCHYCKSRLSIRDALSKDTLEDVNSKFLIDAVTRYTDVAARENNIKAVYYLCLANCNLNKVEEALDLLNEVSRTNPDNKFLSDQLQIVINHVATRLNKYENSANAARKKVKTPKSPVNKKKKILVVEDSSTTRKVVVLTLKQKGYILIEAQDGLEALSKIDEERPDLVLLDIILPKMDGYRILSIIKKTPELKDTPVIMLTSKDRLMDKVRGRLAGTTAYLTKPFEPSELTEAVKKHIR